RKGRRTEIEFMNGYIADRGSYIGVPAPTHAKLTEIVKKVERQEVKAAPALLGGWPGNSTIDSTTSVRRAIGPRAEVHVRRVVGTGQRIHVGCRLLGHLLQ